jgi:hypothetical protein
MAPGPREYEGGFGMAPGPREYEGGFGMAPGPRGYEGGFGMAPGPRIRVELRRCWVRLENGQRSLDIHEGRLMATKVGI